MEKLTKFHAREGHSNVPVQFQDDPKLGIWVNTQRKCHKRLLQGKKPAMSLERVHALEKIGFSWVSTSASGKKHDDNKWLMRYEELKKFKAQFGHCSVPQKWAVNPALGSWVTVQRYRYRHIKVKTEMGLYYGHDKGKEKRKEKSLDRIEALDRLGFQWRCQKSNFKRNDGKWMKKFEQIKIHYEKYGHFQVSIETKEDLEMSRWMRRQRLHYKYLIEGKYSTIDDQRREALESIGIFSALKNNSSVD